MKHLMFFFVFLFLSSANATIVSLESTNLKLQSKESRAECELELYNGAELVFASFEERSCTDSEVKSRITSIQNELRGAKTSNRKVILDTKSGALKVTNIKNNGQTKKKLTCQYIEHSEINTSCSGKKVFISKVKCTDSIGNTFEQMVTCEGKIMPEAVDCLAQNHLLQKSGAIAATPAESKKGAN